MYLIALTGGIAAGKSVVSARLAELGAVIVDADLLAREAVERGSDVLAALEAEFGASVIAGDGSLDRAALGAAVFGHPDRLARLNEITHPAVRRLAKARFEEAARRDPEAVVVYDVPLLVEAGAVSGYDLVVVVEAPDDVRLERLVSLRGMDPDAAAHRIRSQASNADRRAVADVLIDSGSSLETTIAQVDALWANTPRATGGAA